MTYTEFLQNFLSELLKIKSFAGRMKYANENLTKIGQGSGRIVFDIDGEKVLKLAKNSKGIAQNQEEAGIGYYHDTWGIVTKVFESDDDDTWLISEKGKKVTERRIKELTGIPSLNDLFFYVRNFDSSNHGRGNIFHQDVKTVEFLNENEFAQDLTEFIANYSQQPGDYGRPSSYGEVLRDGQPTIVLTDYSLSDEVYSTHYNPKRKENYRIFELYNFADGNDDILSDIGNVGQDQRHGMWALIPDGVGDGNEPMNEEFISYVENRNKYPNKPLPNLPFLNDKFHECVNNLKETLNVVKDKKLFYNNLLELQDYLIEQKYYDRDPLNHEEYVINEVEQEIPKVRGMSLEDENYAKEIVTAATQKLGFNIIKTLGGGSNGFAYDIGNSKIFKITADVGEADAASKLMRVNPTRSAIIYNLYKIVDTEKNMSFFGILEQNIEDKPVEKFVRYENIVDAILPNNMTIVDFFIMMRKKFDYDKLVSLAQVVLTANPEANISEQERKETYEYLIGLFEIKKELLSYNIKSNDYSNPKNLGYDNGVLKFFDIGGYTSDEPILNQSNLIYLPEDGTSIYSTQDSIGSDDFPPYVQNDTSPLADNNVPTDNEIHEDLEYNHVSDATQDKYVLSEEFLGIYDGYDFEVFKNPNSIKNLKPNIRGIVTRDGDFYIIDDNYYVIHRKLAEWLNKKGYPIPTDVYNSLITIVPVQRYENTNRFYISESLSRKYIDRLKKHIISTFKKTKEKNPSVDFVIKSILDANPNDEVLNERIMSSMKGSSTVEVKKKCRLAGQGNTSAACNQGDINNLNIKQLHESVNINLPAGDIQGFGSYEITNDGQSIGTIEIMNRGNKYLVLDKIFINKEFRGAGYANDAIRLLFDYADKQNKIITLTPDNLWGANKEKLKKWYGSLGFVMNKGRNKDFETMQLMYRLPNTNTRLNEVGEGNLTPYEISVVKSLDTYKEYKFVTEDNDEYHFEFNKANLDDNMWRADFGIIDNSDYAGFSYTKVVDKGKLYRVMATILKLMKGFFANTKPDILVIEPIKGKNLDDRRRFSLFLQFIKKHLPSDYEYTEDNKEILIKKKVNSLNESQLMSLQDLPFKQDVEQLGGKIFSVGGAVRDEFLGKESKDLDVLISGVPMDKLEQILSKYGRVDAVGKSFGVLKFKPRGATEEIDIAIPRTEKPTGAGGHQGFDITSDHALPIEKDLERRDFTINAIAKDTDGNIVDPFGGQEDLKNKIIRIVNPEAFSDDPLRMLRAVQFSSRFGFTIEPETMQMIVDNAQRVKEIAPERILTEFDKIIKKGNILTGVELLASTGLFEQIFGRKIEPSMISRRDFSNVKTMGEFIFLMIYGIVQQPAAFFKNNLKGDIDTYKEIRAFEQAFESGEATNMIEARSVAHNMYLLSPQSLQSQVIPHVIKVATQELLQGKYPKTVNELAVNGNDLMQAGLQGKAIGDMQKQLLLNIYANKVRNDKEELLNLVKQKSTLKEFSYSDFKPQKNTWNVNGQEVDIKFFIGKYDEWNQGMRFRDPSKESVLRFMEDMFIEFVHDEKLKQELLWVLTDRDILNEGVEINNEARAKAEPEKIEPFEFDPSMVSDSKWQVITNALTRLGYTGRPYTDWKNYFNKIGKTMIPTASIDNEKTAIIKRVFTPRTPMSDDTKLIAKAKRYFGITNNFKEVGYILLDGSMLNFSSAKNGGNRRDFDHRQVGEIGSDMLSFMKMGNIRMQSNGFELRKMPTKQQFNTLIRFIHQNNDYIIIDFATEAADYAEHSVEYPKGTNINRIINDIINYYKNGIKPIAPPIHEEAIKGILNEMSIQAIDYDYILTPQYVKKLKRSDDYKRYIEYYQYENNLILADEEEIEQSEDFKNWLTYELRARFDDVINNIKNKIKPDGTIDIWRRITVDDIWTNHLLQAGKHLGIYWSWDERAAEAHWGDSKKYSDALIKSSIKEQYIDWDNTIEANMNYSLGEDEKEITLFKNTSLKIEELNIDGQDVEDVMGSDYELQLRNKIFYA